MPCFSDSSFRNVRRTSAAELQFKVNEGWKEMLNHVNYLTILSLSIHEIDGIPLMEWERAYSLRLVGRSPFQGNESKKQKIKDVEEKKPRVSESWAFCMVDPWWAQIYYNYVFKIQ